MRGLDHGPDACFVSCLCSQHVGTYDPKTHDPKVPDPKWHEDPKKHEEDPKKGGYRRDGEVKKEDDYVCKDNELLLTIKGCGQSSPSFHRQHTLPSD